MVEGDTQFPLEQDLGYELLCHWIGYDDSRDSWSMYIIIELDFPDLLDQYLQSATDSVTVRVLKSRRF